MLIVLSPRVRFYFSHKNLHSEWKQRRTTINNTFIFCFIFPGKLWSEFHFFKRRKKNHNGTQLSQKGATEFVANTHSLCVFATQSQLFATVVWQTFITISYSIFSIAEKKHNGTVVTQKGATDNAPLHTVACSVSNVTTLITHRITTPTAADNARAIQIINECVLF